MTHSFPTLRSSDLLCPETLQHVVWNAVPAVCKGDGKVRLQGFVQLLDRRIDQDAGKLWRVGRDGREFGQRGFRVGNRDRRRGWDQAVYLIIQGLGLALEISDEQIGRASCRERGCQDV